MKRPLIWFSLSCITGILAARFSSSYFFIAASITMLILVYYVFFTKYSKYLLIIVIMLLLYSMGAIRYLYIDNANKNRFKAFEDDSITLSGVVSAHPGIKGTIVSYVLRVKSIAVNGKERQMGGKILLRTLTGDEGLVYEYGREIKVSGKLTLPTGKRNPGGFNYRNYLAQSGISASIFAREENIEAGKKSRTNILVSLGFFLNQKIVSVIKKSLPEQQSGLLSGMLIGNREGLTKEVQQVFSDSGLSHIMAVSGANVAFIIFPFIFLLRKLGLKQNISNITALFVLVIFVFITGFEPSVQRAAVMAAVVLIGQILRRDTDVLTSISFAALLLLLINPYNLFNIGFQLSFAATLSLILFYKYIKALIKPDFIPEIVKDAFAVTTAAQIGVLPITVYYFNKFSLVSIISNLLVAPVVEVISILGSIMAVIGQFSVTISRIIGYVNCTLLSFILYVSKLTAGMPFAVVRIITPSILIIILYYLAAGFFLWYKPLKNIKIRNTYYMVGAAVFIIIFTAPMLIPRGLEVVFIDVGQGDSIFIRSYKGKTVLIDGGGSSGMKEDSYVGDSIVIPFLLDYGVARLDLVVATHGHGDHIQGLLPVLEDFGVSNFVLPEFSGEEFLGLLKASEKRNINVDFLQKGDRIGLDDKTFFTVLNPAEKSESEKVSLNNSSLVLKLHYKDVAMLFTGDIEAEIEKKLTEDREDISADILKAAHHGSSTSSTEDFLDAVNPHAVIICVGKNNFGHPSEEVLDRMKERHISIMRTDKNGAVILKTNGRKISLKTMLQ